MAAMNVSLPDPMKGSSCNNIVANCPRAVRQART